MNAWRLIPAWLVARPWSALLNIGLIALSLGALSALANLNAQLEARMAGEARGIDLVVGAKGSPAQIVLSSVYHVDVPTGNIPLNERARIAAMPGVASVIPLALGDSVSGYRLVGTEHAYVTLHQAQFAVGRLWAAPPMNATQSVLHGTATPKTNTPQSAPPANTPLEAVIGAEVARTLKLAPGSTFISSHGLSGGEAHDATPFTVTGVLAPTGGVIDRLVLTSVESIWRLHEDEHGITPGSSDARALAEDRELTALLIKYASPIAAAMLPRRINAQAGLQAASPALESARLFAVFGVALTAMRGFALVLLFAAALALLGSLLRALNERRKDLGVLRLLGARRSTLTTLLMAEGALLGLAGGGAGVLVGHALLAVLNVWMEPGGGTMVNPWLFSATDAWVVLGATITGLAAALIPAFAAYRINVAHTLFEET